MSKPPDIAIEPSHAPKASAPCRRSSDATLGLLFHLLTVTIVVAGVLLAQAAAQDRTSLRDACLADDQRLCSSVTPGGGRIKQCMLDHVDELSEVCRSAILSEVDR
jgi:hypothetical protein